MQKPTYTYPEDYLNLDDPEELKHEVVMSKLESLIENSELKKSGVEPGIISTELFYAFHINLHYSLNNIPILPVDFNEAIEEHTKRNITQLYSTIAEYASNLAALIRIFSTGDEESNVLDAACRVFGINIERFLKIKEKQEASYIEQFQKAESDFSFVLDVQRKFKGAIGSSSNMYMPYGACGSQKPFMNN